MLSCMEKRIVSLLQGDLPLSSTPYSELADQLGIGESELLAILKGLKERGILRRVGAILYHGRVGYEANGMVAWKVPPERAEEFGRTAANFPQASHVYRRPAYPGWPYNLFTMLHGKTRSAVEETARQIAEQTGIRDYIILFSTREFKKSSPRYF